MPETAQPFLQIISIQRCFLIICNSLCIRLIDTFIRWLLHLLHCLVPKHVLYVLELLEFTCNSLGRGRSAHSSIISRCVIFLLHEDLPQAQEVVHPLHPCRPSTSAVQDFIHVLEDTVFEDWDLKGQNAQRDDAVGKTFRLLSLLLQPAQGLTPQLFDITKNFLPQICPNCLKLFQGWIHRAEFCLDCTDRCQSALQGFVLPLFVLLVRLACQTFCMAHHCVLQQRKIKEDSKLAIAFDIFGLRSIFFYSCRFARTYSWWQYITDLQSVYIYMYILWSPPMIYLEACYIGITNVLCRFFVTKKMTSSRLYFFYWLRKTPTQPHTQKDFKISRNSIFFWTCQAWIQEIQDFFWTMSRPDMFKKKLENLEFLEI